MFGTAAKQAVKGQGKRLMDDHEFVVAPTGRRAGTDKVDSRVRDRCKVSRVSPECFRDPSLDLGWVLKKKSPGPAEGHGG